MCCGRLATEQNFLLLSGPLRLLVPIPWLNPRLNFRLYIFCVFVFIFCFYISVGLNPFLLTYVLFCCIFLSFFLYFCLVFFLYFHLSLYVMYVCLPVCFSSISQTSLYIHLDFSLISVVPVVRRTKKIGTNSWWRQKRLTVKNVKMFSNSSGCGAELRPIQVTTSSNQDL